METADPRQGDNLRRRRPLRSQRPAVRHLSAEAHAPAVSVVVVDKGTDQLDGVESAAREAGPKRLILRADGDLMRDNSAASGPPFGACL